MFTLPSRGLSTLAKELTAATRVIQSTSKDLSTLVSSSYNDLSDGLRNRSKRVRTPVALLRSLSGKYPRERYELPSPPSYGLYDTTNVFIGEWLWH